MKRILLTLLLVLGASPLWAQSHPVFFNDAPSLARYAKMKADYEANTINPATIGGKAYKHIKGIADSGARYADTGQFGAYMYHFTGDSAYVALAWTKIQTYLAQPNDCTNSAVGGNGLREGGWQYVIMYDFLYPGLTSEQRTQYRDKINFSMGCAARATTTAWGDSDQTIGEYMMAAMWFKATGDYNSTAATIWNTPGKTLGGWDATATEITSTRRNAIKYYVSVLSEGGAFLESTEYSLNTLKLLILPNAALKTAGVTTFPEIDDWQEGAALAFIGEVTPGISTQTAPYPYLRQDNQDVGLGMMLYYREETCFAFSGVLAGTATGAKVQDWCDQLVTRYPIATVEPYPRGFLVYDDTAGGGDHTTLDRVQYNAGVGLLMAKTGWASTDSMFGVHMQPDHDHVYLDHQTPAIWGSFRLWKDQSWVINHPTGYGGYGMDCKGSNQVCIEGLGTGNAGMLMGYRQYRKIQAHRNDWTNGFHYITGTIGGSAEANGGYAAPQLNLHEYTRSFVWLSNWDTVIVYDRVNSDDLIASSYSSAIQNYINGSPRTELTIHSAVSPTLEAGTMQWNYASGKGAKVYNLLPTNPTRTIVDESTATPWATMFHATQKKFHTLLVPASTLKWNKWFNVWDMYGSSTPSTVTLVQDLTSGVDATLVTKGSQSVLAAFNAIQGRDVPLNINGNIWQNIAPVLDAVRLRTSDYSLTWTSAVATKALLFDLKPSITWTYTVNGGAPVSLTVDSNGIGVADIATTGAITLAVIGGGPINPPVVVTTTVLPDPVVGSAYSQAIAATGGDDGPYTCTLDSGTLPAGLSLNAACATGITGTPSAVESANSLTKTAVAGWGNAGAYSTNSLASGDGYVETTVAEVTTQRYIGLSNGSASNLQSDIDYGAYLNNGNFEVYTFVNGSSRRYTGAMAPGDVIRIGVESGSVVFRQNGTLRYTSPTAPTYPLIVDSSLYHQGATLKNTVVDFGSGVEDVVWAGVTGASTGGGSSRTFAIGVCDSTPDCASEPQSYTISVLSTPTISSAALDNGVVGTPYSDTAVVAGGVSPYVWTIASGAIPDGLSLAPSTGVISGTPTVTGSFSFTLRVTDDAAAHDEQLYGVTIVSARTTLTITSDPGPTSAVIHYGTVNAEDDCVVTLYAGGGDTVLGTVTSTGPGASARTASFSGLTPMTAYGVGVVCDTADANRYTFSTIALPPVGGTVNWTYTVKPHAQLVARSVVNVRVGYQIVGGTPEYVDSACATGCTVTLPLLSGEAYEIWHIWKTAGNATVATSRAGLVAVP